MEWFSSLIEHLASSKTLSSQSKSIENLIGSNKKIWEVNELKESLKNFIPSEMVIAYKYIRFFFELLKINCLFDISLSFRMTIWSIT
jgi:hypothetical protein